MNTSDILRQAETYCDHAGKDPLKLKDLMALAKIGEPIIRSDIVGRL